MQSSRRDTSGGAARGEGGLRQHGRARGGGSGEFLTACGGANGPATRADQGLCVATRGSCHAQPTRPKRATHEGENEGEKKDIFIPTQHARMPQPPHATTFCLQSSISLCISHTHGGQRASTRDRMAAAARESEENERSWAPRWCPRTPFSSPSDGPAGRRRSGDTSSRA